MSETLYKVWGEGEYGWELVGEYYNPDEADRACESYINSYIEEMENAD